MRALLLLLVHVSLFSCSADREPGELFGPDESGMIVIDALLIVNSPLPGIFVWRTQPPGAVYSRARAAVTEGRVLLRQGEAQFPYRADPGFVGRFLPPKNAPVVLPQTAYNLEVEVEGVTVTAATTTPPHLQIREAVLLDDVSFDVRQALVPFGNQRDVYSAPENQLHYQDGLIELRINPVDVVAYQLAIFSLDPDSDFVLEADFLEEDDFAEFERFGASPPLGFPDGNGRLPWAVVAFGGRHLFKVYAIDRNWYDYIRTSPDENDGPWAGGLAGENFQRPLFNIDGGIGLFGSAAIDSVGFFVLPKLPE
jgi:hypothetical protein